MNAPRRSRICFRLAIAAAVCAACKDGPTDASTTQSSLEIPLRITAATSRLGYTTQRFELHIQPYYQRADLTHVPIGARQVFDIGVNASQSVRVVTPIDVGACRADRLRAPSATECMVALDIVLALTNGSPTLDHQHVGPWMVLPRAPFRVTEEVAVAEVGVPLVSPQDAVIRVADTLRMLARFITVTRDTVLRPVVWKSEQTSVATVDQSGLVTGRGTGRAGILAHFGGGQSSNGAVVAVVVP